jgi:transcriptional regulator of arginine metabolism
MLDRFRPSRSGPRDASHRRRRIRELLSRNQIQTQEQLLELLAAEGFNTTQATISRDLRELGVRKEVDGYQLPPIGLVSTSNRKQFLAGFRDVITLVRRGGNLVVIQANPGHASAIAAEVMASGLPEILGAIASSDTVFIATQTAGQARTLMKLIESS